MKKTYSQFINRGICILLFPALISCSMGYVPAHKESVSETEMAKTVSNILDAQLEYVQPILEEKESSDYSVLKSGKGGNAMMKGNDVIKQTLKEEKGRDYVDFCYAVNTTSSQEDAEYVINMAKDVLSEEDYETLCERAGDVKKSIESEFYGYAKGLPAAQQEAFYKDLKTLVVRTVVLMTAGIVYAVIPTGVFWGKVSAAAAISVGAGLVAVTIMSLYQKYRFEGQVGVDNFEEWIKELIKIPKADYAIATTVIGIGSTLNKGPVVAGVVLCVFALFNVVDSVRTMLKTYNFNA